MAIRKIRPAMILRRGMADQKLPLRGRMAAAREAVVLGGIILLGLGGIAGWLGGSARVGGYFAGGLFFSLIALAAVAALLLRLLRVFLRRSPVRLPSLVRQGFANLYRQGNQAQSILVAMGLGVMFTLSVYLIQNSLIDEIIQTAPPGVPNVYLVGVTLGTKRTAEGADLPARTAFSPRAAAISVGLRPAGPDRWRGCRHAPHARLSRAAT